ncbi:MAG: hypothetical protein KDN20_17175, partial [Verrucomicrobiae bacterium]|nr:hypothetical protein [Verrucomicrobiae bacterium]
MKPLRTTAQVSATIAGIALLLSIGMVRGEDAASTPPAPSIEEIEAAIDQGVGFLLADQNENGSWGSARQTKG